MANSSPDMVSLNYDNTSSMKYMERKWEWVREYCKRQGFEESAEIADQIDRVLCYFYEGDLGIDRDSCDRLVKQCKTVRRYIKLVEGQRGGRREVFSMSEHKYYSCSSCAYKPDNCKECKADVLATDDCVSGDSLYLDLVSKYKEEAGF